MVLRRETRSASEENFMLPSEPIALPVGFGDVGINLQLPGQAPSG
jgi:hypothetical protein